MEFPSLHNYTDYCGHCVPACNRTGFETVLSHAPISEFYAKRMAKVARADPGVSAEFEEAQRQQDWALLYFANDSYTTLVFDIANHLTVVYQMTTEQPFEDLANMTRVLSEIENSGSGDTVTFTYLTSNVTELWTLFINLTVFTHQHYLFNYITVQSRRAEELNVRLAVDIQIGAGHTEEYALEVNDSLLQAGQTLRHTKVAWDMFMAENVTSGRTGSYRQADEWNATMYESMASLSYCIVTALEELELAMYLFVTSAPIIQEDPYIKGRTVSEVEISDREFYL